MAIEFINIRVYNTSGDIDSTLSPAISIYDNSNNNIDFSGTMSWNTTTLNYQFSPNIDIAKTYTATVDFWVSATTRYATFWVSYTGIVSSGLTTTQDANLTKAAKALSLPQFIALQNP